MRRARRGDSGAGMARALEAPARPPPERGGPYVAPSTTGSSPGSPATASRRPRSWKLFDHQVHLLDAVTVDLARPGGDPALDIELAALAAVLRQGLSGALPGHQAQKSGGSGSRGGEAEVQDWLPSRGVPQLAGGGHPPDEMKVVDAERAGLGRAGLSDDVGDALLM